MLAPGLFLYVLVRKKLLLFLKERNTYLGLGIFLVFGLGYYFLREAINPGYLVAVWENELGGRFGKPNEGHVGPFIFYVREILEWQFEYYKFLFPAALACGLLIVEPALKRLTAFSFCISVFFLLVISTAQTKLSHYDAPLFPFLAIIIASLIFQLYLSLRERTQNLKPWTSTAITGFVCLCLLANPYYETVKKVYAAKGESWDEGFSQNCKFFQFAVRDQVKLEQYKVVVDLSSPESFGAYNILNCYKRMMNEHGLPVEYKQPDQLAPGEKALVFNQWTEHLMEEKYDMDTLYHYDSFNSDYVLIKGLKTPAAL